MAVPYTFGTATSSIPLSQLDSNFATVITLGNTAIQLGNTVTTLNNMTLANVTISSGNVTITNVTITTANVTTANIGTAFVSGNVSFTGTSNRITGDFSNATVASRVAFQTSTANGDTRVLAITNGTGATSAFAALNGSDANNASWTQISTNATTSLIQATISGTGTYLPMVFQAGGSERMRLDTSGNLGIGTTTTVGRLRTTLAADGLISLFNGTTYGLTITSSSSESGAKIEATDPTGTASFQPLILNGSIQQFKTGGTERARIDSSGNLMVGTTSPLITGKVSVVGNIYGQGEIAAHDTSKQLLRMRMDSSVARLDATFFSGASGAYTPLAFSTSDVERVRIDTSGNLLVGTTSNAYSDKVVVNGNLGISGTQINMAPGADFEFVQRSAFKMLFYVNAATVVANLSITGVWTNASDARYKENIKDSPYGLATVMALKPRAYNLINLADKPQIGFIAQEVIDVVPEVVESVHNSVTNEDRYTLSYGNMVAVLTKAIQEQQALITSLTARITALEST